MQCLPKSAALLRLLIKLRDAWFFTNVLLINAFADMFGAFTFVLFRNTL
jgi:hypothetical protein